MRSCPRAGPETMGEMGICLGRGHGNLGRGRNQPCWDVSAAEYREHRALNSSRAKSILLRRHEIDYQLLERYISTFSRDSWVVGRKS